MAIDKTRGYINVQKEFRAKFLRLQKIIEGQYAELNKELNKRIQRIVEAYQLSEGGFDVRRMDDINRDIDVITNWFVEQSSLWLDENITKSINLAIDGQDEAAKMYIQTLIRDHSGSFRDSLLDALKDTSSPFMQKTQYGLGIVESLRKQVWTRRWVDGHTLSDRVWRTGRTLRTNLQSMIQQCVNEGRSAVEFSRAVENFLEVPGPSWTTAIKPSITERGTIKYNALRLARTETNQGYQQAQKFSAENSALVKGIKRNLSASHPTKWPPSSSYMGYPEICDYYALADHHGFGPGVFPKGEVPEDHPNGLCYLTDVLYEGAELVRILRQKYKVS